MKKNKKKKKLYELNTLIVVRISLQIWIKHEWKFRSFPPQEMKSLENLHLPYGIK